MSLKCCKCDAVAVLSQYDRLFDPMLGVYREMSFPWCESCSKDNKFPHTCCQCGDKTVRIRYVSSKMAHWYCEACIDDGWPQADFMLTWLT